VKTGWVESFDDTRGQGVIRTEEGEKVAVHYTVIDGEGYRSLSAGERVRLTTAPGLQGRQASLVLRD
jgi:CspA family cold shock protein